MRGTLTALTQVTNIFGMQTLIVLPPWCSLGWYPCGILDDKANVGDFCLFMIWGL